MKPSDFFTPAQKTAMVAAIRQAEKDTSGEIRIHFENHCRKNVLDRAAQVFADLKMHKTALRNGVLIYVALEDKQLAILGDAGINAKVPDHFWDDIKNNRKIQIRTDLRGSLRSCPDCRTAAKSFFSLSGRRCQRTVGRYLI